MTILNPNSSHSFTKFQSVCVCVCLCFGGWGVEYDLLCVCSLKGSLVSKCTIFTSLILRDGLFALCGCFWFLAVAMQTKSPASTYCHKGLIAGKGNDLSERISQT